MIGVLSVLLAGFALASGVQDNPASTSTTVESFTPSEWSTSTTSITEATPDTVQDAASRESLSTRALDAVWDTGVLVGTPMAEAKEHCTSTWSGRTGCVALAAGTIALGAGAGAAAVGSAAGAAASTSTVFGAVATGAQLGVTYYDCQGGGDESYYVNVGSTALSAVTLGSGAVAGRAGAQTAPVLASSAATKAAGYPMSFPGASNLADRSRC